MVQRHQKNEMSWSSYFMLIFLVVVMPLGLPVVFGALFGMWPGIILGALLWAVLGLLGKFDQALRYSGASTLKTLRYFVVYPMVGAGLGWLGGILTAQPGGAAV